MAIDQYNSGLQIFRNDITLLIGLARVQEHLGDIENCIKAYKIILEQDPTNVEAIACIGTNYFYNDQPEIALRYYRRILQMGVNSAELFMNLGLCCFFCQQFDLAISCIERAQASANDDVIADVWYNTGNVFLSSGDVKMASRCFQLAMAADPNHAENRTI
ncbi:Tetratricopeptide repeat protein [Dirofilaria immitis]